MRKFPLHAVVPQPQRSKIPLRLLAPCHGQLLGPRAADTRAEQKPSRNTPDIFLYLNDWQFRYAGPLAAIIASIRTVQAASSPDPCNVHTTAGAWQHLLFRLMGHAQRRVRIDTSTRPHRMGCKFNLDASSRDRPFLLVPRGPYDTLQRNAMLSSWSIVRSADLNYCFVSRFRPARTRMDGSPGPIIPYSHPSVTTRPPLMSSGLARAQGAERRPCNPAAGPLPVFLKRTLNAALAPLWISFCSFQLGLFARLRRTGSAVRGQRPVGKTEEHLLLVTRAGTLKVIHEPACSSTARGHSFHSLNKFD